MATIRTRRSGSTLRVAIAGRLTARDMRRLEHTCGPALTVDRLPLQLDLTHMTYMDSTAAAVLARFSERGAIITPPFAEAGASTGTASIISGVEGLSSRRPIRTREARPKD